ncbi:hypothetical protein EA462_07630 [Natrarchaeobius halalkaliphilus]|uniref:Uncharacterized protein n=1 Tax=Natrarchaeobius halalkaliphilus TaxID=1679091 RepID=A0A3N6M8S7_9EURY|nr:hypothetical protein [Natrarchaeobius halalkaliphilus]RQG89876.1 hypothetical protein EA462_07630 [Natrarchaeobius halalkaliphilus]
MAVSPSRTDYFVIEALPRRSQWLYLEANGRDVDASRYPLPNGSDGTGYRPNSRGIVTAAPIHTDRVAIV